MRQGLSINYLAYCLLKWKKIFVCAVIFAVLLGGFQGFQQMKAFRASEEDEVAMQEAVQVYQEQIAEIDLQIAEEQSHLEGINEYLGKSLLMQVNPYQEYVSTIDLAIDLERDEDYQVKVKYDVTPEEYMLQRVQSLYSALWYASDTAEFPYISEIGTEDRYIKEIVAVMNKANGVIEIYVMSASAELSEKLSEVVYDYLVSQKMKIENNSYQHSISVLMKTTKSAIDTSLIDFQNSKYELANSYSARIEELNALKYQLVSPEASSTVVSRVMKVLFFAVVGALVGMVIACGCMIARCVRDNILMGYYEMSDSCDLQFLGATLSKDKLVETLAYKLSRQRYWPSQEKALEFMGENIRVRSCKKDVVLVSSCPLEEKKVLEIIGTLKKKGISAKTIDDALHNEKFFAEIEKNNVIILLEKYGGSNMEEVLEVQGLLQNREKEIEGFILI